MQRVYGLAAPRIRLGGICDGNEGLEVGEGVEVEKRDDECEEIWINSATFKSG